MELASRGKAPERRPKDYLHTASAADPYSGGHILVLNMDFK